MTTWVQASGMALLWFGVVSLLMAVSASIERRTRLVSRADRPELLPPRALWGGGREAPAANHGLLRALAGLSRMARTRTQLADRSPGLRFVGRVLACTALAGAISLVPFAGRFGATSQAVPLVAVDLRHGLVALVLLLLLAALAQVGIGLADRSVWSRLGSVRVASRALASLGLVVLVLSPLALESGSLRLHDIVMTQQQSFQPLAWVSAFFEGEVAALSRLWRWPNWNLFAQPLTALLFVFAIGLLIRRPLVLDPFSGDLGAAGIGLDGSPVDHYWSRMESRLSRLLAAMLFVSLFLGAGAIPFFDPSGLVERASPYVGPVLPALLASGLEIGCFVVKVCLALAGAALLRRATGVLRDDQTLRVVTQRLLPLAWANLLLMAAIRLLSDDLAAARLAGGS